MIQDGFVFLGCTISSFQTRDAKSVLWDHGITMYCADGIAFTRELTWYGVDPSTAFQGFLKYSSGYALDIPLVLCNLYVEQSQLVGIFWAAQQSYRSPCDVYLSVLRKGTLKEFVECAH